MVKKAIEACKGSNIDVIDHFVDVNKIVDAGVTSKSIYDYQLSRYACYLIVQNGDPRKKVIALGQTYFAVKTRQQELIEHFDELDETHKRLAIRRDNIQGKAAANKTHYDVGSKVRQTIKDLGGTMPEDLPTPEKSIKELEREERKKLK